MIQFFRWRTTYLRMKIFIYAAYIGGEYIIYYFTLSHNKWVGLGRDLRNAILVLFFMNLCLCFSFGGTVQYIEESNIYLCFVVCRLKRGLVT